MNTSVRAVPVQPSYVRQRAERLVKDGGAYRVLLLRAKPEWNEASRITIDGRSVHIVAGVSQLAVLDAYTRLAPEEYLVVLTDRSEDDLGDAVRVRAWRQAVERVDEWGAVPGLFSGAREVAAELQRLGDWVPAALLDYQPTAGWPASPSMVLTSDLALTALLAELLRQRTAGDLDAALVMSATDQVDVRSAWSAVERELRRHLTQWAGEAIGLDAAFALLVAASGRNVSPLAVALAADVLWPSGDGPAVEDQIAARARIETYLGGQAVTLTGARAAARTARSLLARWELEEVPQRQVVLQQAEALLRDIGWPAGAAESSVLRAGLVARLRHLAATLNGTSASAVEEALQNVIQHSAARLEDHEIVAARMAVRLWRWLAGEEGDPAPSLDASMRQQVSDGAWADRAAHALWNGSADPVVSTAYGHLLDRAADRRRRRDETAAHHLAEVAQRDIVPAGVTPVERLLHDTVIPWAAGDRTVLLVVLDGMSVAVATEIAQAAIELNMVEYVRETSGQRDVALAVLPTLTTASRTSLFAGTLREGGMAEEKAGLAAAVPGSVVFHKDDLRASAGAVLPDTVLDAVRDPARKVVGIVINTIDDTLHKQDTSSTRWSLDRLTPLRELLNAAVIAQRTVVLTSDHGHVVEHSTETVSAPDAQGRWRSPGSGQAADGEVFVRGSRVLAPGAQAVLLWREDRRYGRRQTGYHGGASLAEITVPVIVLRGSMDGGARGWQPAAPQAPTWWNDPAVATTPPAEPAVPPVSPKRSSKRRSSNVIGQIGMSGDGLGQSSLFDIELPVTVDEPAPGTASTTRGLAAAVVASPVYTEQRKRAGRAAVPDAQVVQMLTTLLEHGGRAHRDTVAAAAQVPVARMESTLAVLRRLLNVDGYSVIDLDLDRTTVRLDIDLLFEQFDIEQDPSEGGARG